MVEINEKSHVSVLIGSLDKIYKKAQFGQRINSTDLYYLNIIYKLLNNCCLELTNAERKKLLSLYSHLYHRSKIICPASLINKYQITKVPKFIQAETTDCNTYPHANKIFYWQEENLSTILSNIQPLVDDTDYLNDKLFDTFANFELGKTIEYTNIGRICFLAMESSTLNYEIKDEDNIDVTDAFDIVLIPSINSTLFVSKNYFSHGNINFKIKKL